jgi:hypothetical protein
MGKQLLKLSDLSTEELARIEDEVEATLTTVFKISTRRASLSFEERMTNAVGKAWKKTAKQALTASLKSLLKVSKKKFTAKSIKTFLARIGVAMKTPLTPAQVEVIGTRLESIYKIGKRLAAKEAKFSFSFGATDARAVKAIGKQQVFWIGDFYNSQLSERIAAVTDDVLLQQGLGPKEAGKELQRVLNREFGLTKGGKTRAALQVPARYAGNPEHYFRQLAANTAHRARTFGKITAFEEAGITRYRILNPLDSRTGRVCQVMANQEFDIVTGVKQRDAILAATSPKQVKSVAPWLSGEELEDVVGSAKPGSKQATEALTDANQALPPFHPLCRSEPVVIFKR